MWRVTYAGVLRGNICVDGTMSGVQTILFYILGSTLPGQAQFTLSKIIFFFFFFSLHYSFILCLATLSPLSYT